MNPITVCSDLQGFEREEIEAIESILPILRYEGRRLQVGPLDAHDLYSTQQVPLIIYIASRIRDNYLEIDSAFRRYFPSLRTYFALKSCYLRPVVEELLRLGAGLEVMSHMEVEIARALGCSNEQIISNGVGRSPGYVRATVTPPVGTVIVDSCEDLQRVSAQAVAEKTHMQIGVRVTPDVNDATRYIGNSSKLGVDLKGSFFFQLLEDALGAPNCHISTLHAHQLTHANDLNTYRLTLRGVANVAKVVAKHFDFRFPVIDIGGGLDTRYLLNRRGLDASSFAQIAAEELKDVSYDFQLQIEPGRYIVADAAVGLTGVTGEKYNGQHRWRITELGSNILIPLPEIAYHPLPTLLPVSVNAEWADYDVGDSTCAPSNLCRKVNLPMGDEGRTLAILNCGAYTTVFAELWAFRLPRILYCDSNGVKTLFGDAEHREMLRAFYQYDFGDFLGPAEMVGT